MGNKNSPEHSPNRFSRPHRILSNNINNKNNEVPVFEKQRIIRNLSKLSKILAKPKNIMTFISQTENFILLKNMNNSTNIGLNHLNILIENSFNNPFLENQIKYLQIIDDTIDKEILVKLNYQNKEYNQKQMENLINNLIEINDNVSNMNIGNISSIHKRNGKFLSREESPISQRDDELDLTSFSTTIGGKISSTASNYINNKNQNSKQIKTFKIRKKNGLTMDGNYNSTNNNNINNYKNISSRQDSPNSINSINSSNNISNVLSSINATNIHSKNSSNTSLKEKNSKTKDRNNDRNNSCNNNIINNNILIKENNSNSYYNNNKANNTNYDIKKIISKKIVKKKLLGPQKKNSSPQDNIKSPRKKNINININKATTNTKSNIHKNCLSNIDNINLSNLTNVKNINNNINNDKKIKPGFVIPKLNITDDNRAKSPNSILNNKILNNNNLEEENENSQIIFNNVRTLTQRNNYSYSNNNSSMINNMSSLNQNSKINNTNIINDEKYIKILNDSEYSQIKTEPNKEVNSYIQDIGTKKKLINEKNNNPFKKNKNINKNNKTY